MDAALERRVSVATCWATTRIKALDSTERYEDSYALTQEFREWITCIGESPELFAESVMSVGQVSEKRHGHDLEEGFSRNLNKLLILAFTTHNSAQITQRCGLKTKRSPIEPV